VKERRIFADPVEVRGEADGSATIAGYAAVFGNEYEVMGFTESVDPKAFNRSLRNNSDLAVVWSHDADRVLGTEASGSARFAIDEHGLRYEADLDLLDPDGLSAYRKIRTGKVRQSSFSFEVVRDSWEEREDAPPHRTLKEVRLWEASPVLWGANPETQVDVKRAARSLAEALAVEGEVQSVPEVIDLAHEREAATTPDPPVDPPPALDDTPAPEPERTPTRPAFMPGT
jgi:HK97 family phage prohead protease